MSGNIPPLKQQAHALIDNLPASATWDDVAYEAELRASIEHGLLPNYLGSISSRLSRSFLTNPCGTDSCTRLQRLLVRQSN